MYFTTEATTIKGDAIDLGSGIKRTNYLPKKDRDFLLQLELFAKIKDQTTIRLYQNCSLLVDKLLPQEMTDAYIDLYDAEIFVFDLWFGRFLDYLHLESEVGLIDIMPFMLNYYNIPFDKKTIDGIDLMQVIRGEKRNRALISSRTSGFYIRSLRFKISRIDNHQKIIFNLPYTGKILAFFHTPPPPYSQFEYYDLLQDPREKTGIHESQVLEIRKYRELFEVIVQKGRKNLTAKDKPIELDKNFIEALKSLGYAH